MSERPKEFSWFEGQRILLRRLVNRQQRLMASLFDETVITNKNLYVLKPKGGHSIKFLLGLMNSRLFSRMYLAQISQATKDDFPQVTIKDLRALPVCSIDSSDSSRKSAYKRMISLVDAMLTHNKQLSIAKSDSQKNLIQSQIDSMDAEIDQLVYQLYELTPEQIDLVESNGCHVTK